VAIGRVIGMAGSTLLMAITRRSTRSPPPRTTRCPRASSYPGSIPSGLMRSLWPPSMTGERGRRVRRWQQADGRLLPHPRLAQPRRRHRRRLRRPRRRVRGMGHGRGSKERPGAAKGQAAAAGDRDHRRRGRRAGDPAAGRRRLDPARAVRCHPAAAPGRRGARAARLGGPLTLVGERVEDLLVVGETARRGWSPLWSGHEPRCRRGPGPPDHRRPSAGAIQGCPPLHKKHPRPCRRRGAQSTGHHVAERRGQRCDRQHPDRPLELPRDAVRS